MKKLCPWLSLLILCFFCFYPVETYAVAKLRLTLAPNIPSPQVVGRVVTFTVSTSAQDTNYEFQFWVKKTQADWKMVRNYNPSPTWVLDSAGMYPGTSYIKVNARKIHSKAVVATASLTYVFKKVPQATGVTITPDIKSPRPTGAKITFSAAGKGGTGNYEFQFWLKRKNRPWQMVRGYAAEPTWIWDSSGMAPDIYQIAVNIRSIGSLAQNDKRSELTYRIIPVSPTSKVKLSASKTGPFLSGETVNFNAVGSGGNNVCEYQFWLKYGGGDWRLARGYSTVSVWSWNSAGAVPGVYSVAVHARTFGSVAQSEAKAALSFEIKLPDFAAIQPAGPDRLVAVGERVLLKADSQVDADLYSLRWSLAQAPEGSSAVIEVDAEGIYFITPDVPGSYLLSLSVAENLGIPYADPMALTATPTPTYKRDLITYDHVNLTSENVSQRSDGGYWYAAVYMNRNSEHFRDIRIARYDADGKVLWSKFLGFNNMGSATIKATADGGCLIAGNAIDDRPQFNAYALRLNEQGEILWYRPLFDGRGEVCNSFIETSDGGVLLLAERPQGILNCYEAYVAKIDSAGNLMWDYEYFRELMDEFRWAVETDDGGFILAGATYYYMGASWYLWEICDLLVISLNDRGELNWDKVLTDNTGVIEESTRANGLILTSDGGLAMAVSRGPDAYLVKADIQGNIEWVQSFTDQGLPVYLPSIIQTNDNGFLMAGRTFAQTGDYPYAIKTDQQGNQTWSRHYNGNNVGGIQIVKEVPDGGYIFRGSSYFGDIHDFWAKTTAEGWTAPVSLGLADLSVTADESINMDVSENFESFDGDTMTFTAQGLPDGLDISPDGVISGRIDSDLMGESFFVAVIATTSNGLSNTASLKISVH